MVRLIKGAWWLRLNDWKGAESGLSDGDGDGGGMSRMFTHFDFPSELLEGRFQLIVSSGNIHFTYGWYAIDVFSFFLTSSF